ncbi:AI-2E family transporter [bacterium]|nr:AI-2E family transporter [bacterium]
MNDSKHSIVVFFVGYIVLFYLLGLMLWPFLSSIIFAGILAGSFSPLMNLINNRLQHPKWSASLVCLIIVLAIFLPSVFIIIKLSEEALNLYQAIGVYLSNKDFEQIFANKKYFPDLVKKTFELMHLEFNFDTIKGIVLEASKNASSAVFDIINSWISNIFSFFLHFIIMLIVIFTLLVDGARIKSFILALSPLPDDEEELVIDRFNQINYVTLIGNGIGALIQGVLAGIGFWVAGIESLTLWTTMMIVLAFIPLVGISIIYIPVCLYLLLSGDTITSIMLFSYCTLISLVVENWFKPRFVGNRSEINSTAIFLSIVGGLAVFGIPGIFYGPLIISIFLTFVDLYHKRYTDTPV